MSAGARNQTFACAQIKGPVQTPPVLSAAADQTAPRAGLSPERPLVSAEGCWSNCDVYVALPADWVAADVTLRLYAQAGGLRALIATTTVSAAVGPGGGLQVGTGGDATGIVLSGRGHYADGWLVVAATATSVGPAQIALELWGHESTPEGIGPTAASGALKDASIPSRASHLVGWYATTNRWLPVAVDASGQLITSGGGGSGMNQITLAAATGAVAIDPSTDSGWRVEAVGDVVLTPSSAFVEGVDYVVYFVQDATGNRGLAFDGAITVHLPTAVDSLRPNAQAAAESAFLFRAVTATELELVATAGVEVLEVLTDQIYSSTGEPLYLEGGSKTFGAPQTTNIVASLGEPDAASGNESARFIVFASDDSAPPNPFNAVQIWTVGDGGVPNVPATARWSFDLNTVFEIDTSAGRFWSVFDVTTLNNYFEARSFQTSVWSNGTTFLEAQGDVRINGGLTAGDVQITAQAVISAYAPTASLGPSAGDERLTWDGNKTLLEKSAVQFVDVTTAAGVLSIDRFNVISAAAATTSLPPGSAALDGLTLIAMALVATTTSPNGADLINGAATPLAIAAGQLRGFTWRQADGSWYVGT